MSVCLRVCVFVCVRVFVCVCELSEQEEWFHLDLIHLGGNLLVNRLVHELRRVDLGLFVCNIACGQFRFFFGRPQIRRLTTDKAPQKIRLLCKKIVRSLYFLSFPDLENSHARLFAAFLAHMAKVPIVTILLPN